MAEEMYEYIIAKCKEQVPTVERGRVRRRYESQPGKRRAIHDNFGFRDFITL